MYYMLKRYCIALLLTFFSVTETFSQEWETGSWLGVSNYFGDLNTSTSFRAIWPAGGLIVRRNYDAHWAMRYSVNVGMLSYKDEYSNYVFQQARNLEFKSNVFDLTAQLEFNFFEYITGDKDAFFSPYLLGGLSIFYFQPKASFDNRRNRSLRQLGTEGQSYSKKRYALLQFALPYGVGFKHNLGRAWNLGIEISNHRAFTDYIDDLSTLYPDPVEIVYNNGALAHALSDRSETPNLIGVEGKQRGNSQTNDSYLFVAISFTYTIRSLRCFNDF